MARPIETLEQLRDIDRELGERLQVEPELSWQVMNADETASCYSGKLWGNEFQAKANCEKWLAEHHERNPNSWVTTQGYHVGSWKTYPAFSTDGNAMLQLIELMAKRGYSFEMRSQGGGSQNVPRILSQRMHRWVGDGRRFQAGRRIGRTNGAACRGWQMNLHELTVINAALAYRRAVAIWDALVEDENIAAGINTKIGSATAELVRCKRALFEACDEYERVPD